MSQRWYWFDMLIVLVVLVVPSNCAAVWDSDIGIFTSPASPTNTSVFDLYAVRSFPDSGYMSIDQSFNIRGNEIDIWALIQDHHSRPNYAFAQVITHGGAFFNDFGPLAAGAYQVNVEIWMTTWPETSGGYLLDAESLPFLVTGPIPEPATAGMFILGLFALSSRRRAGELHTRYAVSSLPPLAGPRLSAGTAEL